MNRLAPILASLVLASIAVSPTPAHGQETTEDVGGLSRQMAERVRELGKVIEAQLGDAPAGPDLVRDTRELAQALDEFHKALPGTTNSLKRRQRFGGIDASWHHLLGQMSRAGISSTEVENASRSVAAVDARLHKALGANQYPTVYYGSKVSPGGMAEVERLAHALVDRPEVLVSLIKGEMEGPIGSRLADEAARLSRAADAFHDGINLDARPDDLTRNGFAEVVSASDLLAADFAGIGGQAKIPDRVRAAWRSYQATENLIRQALKLSIPQAEADANANANPYLLPSLLTNEARSSVAAQADQLVNQVNDFLIVFTPEARNVAEGGEFIADARRLSAAASSFRSDITRAIDVGQLAYAYRDVDALWQRLARRTNRIANGRTGPDVELVAGIGRMVTEIHRYLGMPGFPAVIGEFDGQN